MYIQLPDKETCDKLGAYLDSLHIEKKGLFLYARNINFPTYYKVKDTLEYLSWQSSVLTDGSYWSDSEYEANYNSGVSVDAILHPNLYPEYFI